MKRFLLATSVALALCTGGCSNTQHVIEAEFQLEEARLMVVPFRTERLWHYESPEGNALARIIRLALQKQCDEVLLVADEPVADAIHGVLEDQVPWQQIGQRAGASLILTGKIDRTTFSDPKTPGMLQGRLVGDYQIHDVATERVVFRREFRIRVPENPETGRVYISFEQSEEDILRAMQGKLGVQIGQTLCGFVDVGRPQ